MYDVNHYYSEIPTIDLIDILADNARAYHWPGTDKADNRAVHNSIRAELVKRIEATYA